DDGHLAAHAVVDDEVAPGHLAHELGEDGQLHVLEVERDGGLLGGRGGGGGGEREEERGSRPHRRSETRVRGASPRTMSSATRGSVRSRWRKPRSAAGSATCAPFTRSTTSPFRSPSLANRLSSRIW